MNKKFVAAGMAAAMAATMLPSMAFADEKPTVTLLVPEYNAGKSLKNEGSDQVIQMVEDYTGFNFDIKWGDNGAYDQVIGTTLMDFDNMPMIITCGGSMKAPETFAPAACRADGQRPSSHPRQRPSAAGRPARPTHRTADLR